MKILSAAQTRDWDRFTMQEQGISSIELMERAARACAKHLVSRWRFNTFVIFAGHGNNGGDGLAIARLLKDEGSDVKVYHLYSDGLSDDCRHNLEKLLSYGVSYTRIMSPEDIPASLPEGSILVDALLGTGQNRPPEGIMATLIGALNNWDRIVVAIDLPTGMYADRAVDHSSVVRARYTLSFQAPKLGFFIPENEGYVGQWELLDIGLSGSFPETISSPYSLTEMSDIRAIIKPRARFSHKGSHGTALLLAGSKGMMGAAILASRACLRAGPGKLYTHLPACGLDLLQLAVPEAICSIDKGIDQLEQVPVMPDRCTAIGVGPGLGQKPVTRAMLSGLLDQMKEIDIPMILDADALNIIAAEGWQHRIPKGAVLTPHLLEFSRLFGPSDHHFARLEKALEVSHRLGIFILLKGRYSFLSTPNGMGWFNSTGNPGLAKAGSGDVLTGILTGILAQKYSTDAGSRLAAFIHGMAGDLAMESQSEYGITASDLIDKIGFCYVKVFQN